MRHTHSATDIMLCPSGEMCAVMYVYHDKLLNLFLAIDHTCVVNVSIIQIKKKYKNLLNNKIFPPQYPIIMYISGGNTDIKPNILLG